jgi:hypothetical protein
MFRRFMICIAMSFSVCLAADKAPTIDPLQPYQLPAEVSASIKDVAAQSDVLILGEVHGTQEVPMLAASLLPNLTELGYHVLALEIPSDQLTPLKAWASGKTNDVPEFFAKPSGDGRGNMQLLSLIRAAASPKFQWQLICFDQSESHFNKFFEGLGKNVLTEKATSQTLDLNAEFVKTSIERDCAMAANLAIQRKRLPKNPKVLAICGNLHARTANKMKIEGFGDLWPSFAAKLQSDNPKWVVRSINVVAHSGSFFNNGKVNSFHGKKTEKVEAQATPDSPFNWQLNQPRATAATFLAPPMDLP